MNKKGLFSFVLLLVLVELLLLGTGTGFEIGRELRKGKKIALEIEKANFLRTELEQNIDELIKKELDFSIVTQNAADLEDITYVFDSEIIKELICSKLLEYFKNMEARFDSDPRITFWLDETKPEKEELKKQVKIFIYEFGGKIIGIDFTFSGNDKKGKLIAVIEFNEVKEEFSLPKGYMIRRGLIN